MGNASSNSGPDDNKLRVFCVSDLHTHWEPNEAIVKSWCAHDKDPTEQQHTNEPVLRFHSNNDVIIVAGDIATDMDIVYGDTLQHLSNTFGHVFYIPGNNEARVIRNERFDSIEKLAKIKAIADSFPNVYTSPKTIADVVTIVPLYAWYESSFDPDWNGDYKYQNRWYDFRACQWPDSMYNEDGTLDSSRVSEYFIKMNKESISKVRKSADNTDIISFSHFVPRYDLLPNKFWLHNKTMPLVVGTARLEKQIRKLGSQIHVFGHTHLNVDKTLEGVRYVQNALGHPRERRQIWRLFDGHYVPKLIYEHLL